MNYDNTWRFGANFLPSSAINQLEMWQEDTFDPATIDREFGFAASIGMSVMRIYLHDLAFEQDPEGFLGRMDRCFELAAKHRIKVMPCFFDDCWRNEFAAGKQPEPIPYTHNSGWIQSPGNAAADDPAEWPRLERYVKTVMARFSDDKRILMWDLYNEPGNGAGGDHVTKTGLREERSMPLLQAVFRWAREVGPSQPLTSASWNRSESFENLSRFQHEHSDVVSFHGYMPPEGLEELIVRIKAVAGNRPVICSEYMARTAGSTFDGCLPILKKHNVMAINWGLVSGKSQTVYPWRWTAEKGTPPVWFHDVFEKNGALLYEAERRVFEAVRA